MAFTENNTYTNGTEADISTSLVEDFKDVFEQYQSEIEFQLNFRIHDSNNQESINEENVIEIIDDEDAGTNTRQLMTAPVVNLTGIQVLKHPKNIMKIFPKHRSKMEKTLEFLSGKKEDDLVNPHIKYSKGYLLYVRDLVRLLTPRAWLNDVIILNYISLLVENLSEIVVLEPDILIGFSRNKAAAIKSWKKHNSSKSYNYVVTPINPNNNHWVLLVIDIKKKILYTFDSFDKIYQKESELVLSFIETIIHGSISDTMIQNYKYIKAYSPQQKNTYDCGVFTCTNARYYLLGGICEFTQQDTKLLRQRIAWELINNTIIPLPK